MTKREEDGAEREHSFSLGGPGGRTEAGSGRVSFVVIFGEAGARSWGVGGRCGGLWRYFLVPTKREKDSDVGRV